MVDVDLDSKLCDQLEVVLALGAPFHLFLHPTEKHHTARGMAGCDQAKPDRGRAAAGKHLGTGRAGIRVSVYKQ